MGNASFSPLFFSRMSKRSYVKTTLVFSLFFIPSVNCFLLSQPPPRPSFLVTVPSLSGTVQRQSLPPDDSSEHAEPLPLTPDDLRRLGRVQSRHTTLPVMILDAILPRQQLTFQSADPKFRRLVEYCLDRDTEMGMIGLNPHTSRPLCRGVTLRVSDENIERSDDDTIQLSVRGERRMEVQGEPWLDETESFYLADVEILEDLQEELNEQERQEAIQLSETLPALVKEWKQWVLDTKATDQKGMDIRMEMLGSMPDDLTERALWVAAVINPLPALGVCLEIRPAMLACSNDYDRMVLACQAVQSSIDHLSGKRRLF